jgi:hypothetical protein
VVFETPPQEIPRVYEFHPVSAKGLSGGVSPELLLTQLRYRFLTLSGDEIVALIGGSVDQVRPEEVFLLLQHLVRGDFSLDALHDIDLSEVGLADLIPLLRRSNDVSAFLELTDWKTAVPILSFPHHVNQLRHLARVRTRQLISLMKTFGIMKECDQNKLIDLCLTCFHTAKIHAILPLLGNIVSKLQDLPQDFLTSTLESLSDHLPFLPLDSISQLLLRIISRFRTGTELPALVSALLSREDLYGPPHARLLEAMLVVDSNVADVHPLISSLLASWLPSFFRSGVQLAARVVKELPPGASRDPMRSHFSTIFSRIQPYEHIDPVISLLPEPLSAVIQDIEFDRLRTRVLKELPKLLWKANDPNFIRFAPVFVAVIGTVEQSLPLWHDTIDLTHGLVGPIELVRLSLSCELEKIGVLAETTIHQGELAMEAFLVWLGQDGVDCYDLAQEIYEWGTLIEQFYGFEDTLLHLAVTAARYGPRFFPCFAGIARFCSEHAGNEHVSQSLTNAAGIYTEDRYQKPFLHAAETGEYRRALKLAEELEA